MELTSTKKQVTHVKCLIYGKTGVGKTPLGATAPRPIILDTDDGLLSIADLDLPVLEVRSLEDLEESYEHLKSKKYRKRFDTIIIDDITELLEIILEDLKEKHKDLRQAHYALSGVSIPWVRKIRKLPYNIVMLAKAKPIELDGEIVYRPSVPGQKLMDKLPYMFDEVLALRLYDEDEERFTYLQTQPSDSWDAKDRSKKLNTDMEEPNLKKIFDKILSPKKDKKNGKTRKRS